MSFFTVNHDEAKGGDFQPLPISEYEMIVSNAEIKESSNGNPMIKLELTVRDDLPQEGQKRKIWDNLVFTDGAKWRVQQALKAFGFDNGQSFASIEEVAKALLYKPVRIKNKHEQYDKKDAQGRVIESKVSDRVDYYMNSHVPKVAAPAGGADPFAAPQGSAPDPFAGMGTPAPQGNSGVPFDF